MSPARRHNANWLVTSRLPYGVASGIVNSSHLKEANLRKGFFEHGDREYQAVLAHLSAFYRGPVTEAWIANISNVPIPGAVWLLGSGLTGLGI